MDTVAFLHHLFVCNMYKFYVNFCGKQQEVRYKLTASLDMHSLTKSCNTCSFSTIKLNKLYWSLHERYHEAVVLNSVHIIEIHQTLSHTDLWCPE